MIPIGKEEAAGFRLWLVEREYSPATVKKYMHDVAVLQKYAGGPLRDRNHLNGFRAYLESCHYSGGSINSMLGAVNRFLSYLGQSWRLRYVKVQRRSFLPERRELFREEYERMTRLAEKQGDTRLAMLLQTVCSLGIRISELSAVTVESLDTGWAEIRNKGKLRTILIPKGLAERLKAYCASRDIRSGPVFVTRTGRSMDRSNIWKMMKRLAAQADVAEAKAFPHNLRHLFARSYYRKFRDIVALADILGHSSIDTTRIYTARSGHEERRQLDQLRLLLE